MLWDFYYSDEIIRGMVCLFQNRNADCMGLEKAQKAEKGKYKRYYMDLYTAENKHRQSVDSRKRFEAVLNYIPDEAKEQAASAYERKLWEWIECYYKCRRVFFDEEEKLNKEQQELFAQHKRMKEELDKLQRNENCNLLYAQKMPQPNEIMQGNLPATLRKKKLDYFQELYGKETKLNRRCDEIEEKIRSMQFGLEDCSVKSRNWLAEEYGEQFAEIWDGFKIEDPYQLCFGFLYLLDKGSDLPWLYFPGINLMSHYAALLPWPRNDYEDDAEWLLSYHKNNAIDPVQQKMERDEIYGLRYTVENVDSCYTERFNLAQIVYESTGCILPRDLEHFSPALAATGRFEIQKDKSASLLICCLALQRAINQQSAKENTESASEINTGMQVNPVSEDEENSNDELKMQIKTLRSELSQLKSNYYEASREVAEERKRYEFLKNQVENERKELADLRELLFRQKNQQVEETPDASISFPYHTNRRIIVFGGHDSWAREIKPKLPDVRFINKEMLPNADMIRRADVVWIQHNALAHKYYYNIINIVRKYDIPVKYFFYASATKCAEQIAREEMGLQ